MRAGSFDTYVGYSSDYALGPAMAKWLMVRTNPFTSSFRVNSQAVGVWIRVRVRVRGGDGGRR